MKTDGAGQKNFIFCAHAHQPVGNFDSVFGQAVEKCYSPFFDVVEKHPRVPVVFHMSGSLIDWLQARRPDFIDRLRVLSRTHQIEFLGGAYYEPIYGLIPKRDLLGQIARMQKKMEELFGKKPAGAWLTERVWDPELVEALSQSGIEYTVLDDIHFERAGVAGPVTGYYTANGGPHAVDLFASMKSLRYQIPFRDPRDVVRAILSMKTGPERAIVFADDCEKFGFWPGTSRWVYGEKWLDRFFTLLENEPLVRVVTFSRFRGTFGAVRKVHIPHASYEEMMEWSGGKFDNFLEKYPESRYMKERMWRVSEDVAGLQKAEDTTTALYRAQCNCSYWHGIFGGLYLHHLRAAVFENLIKADAPGRDGRSGPEELRFDSGSRWRVRQERIVSYFNPGYGAALEELDFLPKAVNLLCTLQRRPEPYHRFVFPNTAGVKASSVLSIHQLLGVKDPGLRNKICYDPYRKLSFLDHFFADTVTADDFKTNRYQETGDFIGVPYDTRLIRMDGCPPELCFERVGSVRALGESRPVSVQKKVRAVDADRVRVEYLIGNEGKETLKTVFGVEFNFSIGEELLSRGVFEEAVSERWLRDSWRGVEIGLRSEPASSMTACPIETVSESEGGIEGTFQQIALLFQRKLSIAPGASQEHVFELEIR